jgi:hypothetical protein
VLRRLSHEIGFRVTGAVSFGDDGVFGGQQNLAILVNEQCAKGMIAMSPRSPCEVNRDSR